MPVAAGVVRDLRMAARRVLAARDISAERRRATALDRSHHLQLVEAHVPAVGLTPSRTVIAENVRDFQSWSSHGRGLRRRRLLGVSPHTLAARPAQAIEWALDLGNYPGRNAGIAGRRLQLLVSEQRLNHANVRAALKQMGREAVAKRMQREGFTQARPALEVADILRDHGPAWRETNSGHMSLDQLKVMTAIERCRTAALVGLQPTGLTRGGYVARCENAACGHTQIAYNSCRNRHCPKCQAAASRRWLADREAELLPVPYFHVVYTLPSELRDIAYQNKR